MPRVPGALLVGWRSPVRVDQLSRRAIHTCPLTSSSSGAWPPLRPLWASAGLALTCPSSWSCPLKLSASESVAALFGADWAVSSSLASVAVCSETTWGDLAPGFTALLGFLSSSLPSLSLSGACCFCRAGLYDLDSLAGTGWRALLPLDRSRGPELVDCVRSLRLDAPDTSASSSAILASLAPSSLSQRSCSSLWHG